MSAAFDTYLIIDWSAANAPKRGKDSIWIAEARRRGEKLSTVSPINPPTRSAAIEHLIGVLEREIDAGRRIFAGFDFPFGYPAGAAKIIAGRGGWDALWATLAAALEDGDDNRSNRYRLAETWNRDVFGEPVFWGRPHQHLYECLPTKKAASALRDRLEWRLAERAAPPAKSVWQLAYAGAVGSQAMLGMARLQKLRRRFGDRARVWPFETGFSDDLNAPLTIAEVYPSMFPLRPRAGEVKDRAQVRTVAKRFAALDSRGKFRKWLSRPPSLTDAEVKKVLREEGWIVGAGHGAG